MFTSYSAADLTNPLSSARIAIDAAVAAVIADKLGRPSNKVTVTGVTITSSQRLLGQLQQQQQAQSPQQQHRQLHSLHVIPSARHLAGSSTTVSIQTSLLPYGGANNLPQGLLSSLLQSNTSSPSSSTSNGAVAPVFALQGVTSTTLLPQCGNGVCESGERPGSAGASGGTACAADCPFPVLNCPTVNGSVCNNAGVCVSATGSSAVTVNGFNGMCNCWILQGYTGDACDACDPHYDRHASSSPGSAAGTTSQCVFLPGALSGCDNQLRDGNEAGVDCGGVCPACGAGALGSTSRLPAGHDAAGVSSPSGVTASQPMTTSVTAGIAVGSADVLAA